MKPTRKSPTDAAPLIARVGEYEPEVHEDAFLAPGVIVVGRVRIGRASSVWYGSVLRGDDDDIVVGEECNIQDLSMLHSDEGMPAVLGDRVSLGHRATVHGATVDGGALIGMGAIVLNGARVGAGALVAAGAVVRQGAEIPPGTLAAGVPAKVLRELNEDEIRMVADTWRSYVRKARLHRSLDTR